MTITVYGFPNTRSTRVTWALEELELDYQFQLVDFAKGESRSEAYLAINPAGKVPALQTEQGCLTESLAIVNYLTALKPDRKLAPEDGSFERAQYDQWGCFALTELEQPLWTIGKHKFALPKERRCADVIPTAQWEFQQALKLLARGLAEQEYILGSNFSAADILIGHTLFWGTAFKQPIEAPALQNYIQRLSARPALAAARKKEQAALQGAEAD